MGIHAKDHLQSARTARTAGSRQPPLSGVPLGDRRSPHGGNKLDKLSQTVEQQGRRYSGFNLFDPGDETLLCSVVRGEFNISGLQNKTSCQKSSESECIGTMVQADQAKPAIASR